MTSILAVFLSFLMLFAPDQVGWSHFKSHGDSNEVFVGKECEAICVCFQARLGKNVSIDHFPGQTESSWGRATIEHQLSWPEVDLTNFIGNNVSVWVTEGSLPSKGADVSLGIPRIEHFHYNANFYHGGRRIPRISDIDPNHHASVLEVRQKFCTSDSNICPHLLLTDISRNLGHPLGFTQRGPDQIHRANAKSQPDKAGIPHHPRKPGHGLLSIKIALGALTIFGGFYFLANAVTQGRRSKVGPAVALYPLCGLISIAAGSLLIAHSLLG